MAYIESFLLYIAVVMFMFVVLFGGVVFLYMLFGQLKIFFSKEEVTLEIEKNFLFKLIKNKFFKFAILAYFATFAFSYINQATNYFGSDRAYPKAKAYAIVADTVYLWHSIGVNIAIHRRWSSIRLVSPENKLNEKIQKVQTFLLNKMYQYIPEEDGEREFWYYKYKQLYIAKIRYKPGGFANPHPRFQNFMDAMYDTSYKLYNKSFRDKIINKQRYVPIAEMAYYLANNIYYYASYKVGNDAIKMYKFMDDKELFQRAISYEKLLANVYKTIQTDREVEKHFDNKPYALGLLYGGALDVSDFVLTHYTKYGANPCELEEMQRHLQYIQDFYYWALEDKKSSFNHLSSRQQKQIYTLIRFTAFSANARVANYICDVSFEFIQLQGKGNFRDYHFQMVPNFQNDKDFVEEFGISYYDDYIDLKSLLQYKNTQTKEK